MQESEDGEAAATTGEELADALAAETEAEGSEEEVPMAAAELEVVDWEVLEPEELLPLLEAPGPTQLLPVKPAGSVGFVDA